MIDLFQKIPATLPEPGNYIKKGLMAVTYMIDNWFIYKQKTTPPPLKNQILSK